ncbi:PIN domain-containing protein [Candidatus Daviesbacteria bacterium]|nr:PIN domain-containing protein [Candidatus Daviesbacteria bacterium]
MKLLDANVILRFLLKDHPEQSPAAKKILENRDEMLLMTDVVLAEVIWVLNSLYQLTREEIADKIYQLLNLNSIYSNKELLIRALYFYRNFNISYIDAYLAAYGEQNELEGIYSFDKGLDKIKSVRRLVPK